MFGRNRKPVEPIVFNTAPGAITWVSDEQLKAFHEDPAWFERAVDRALTPVMSGDGCRVTMALVK